MPWCWRWPPTTSSSMSRNSAPPASPGSKRRRPATSSPSASRRAAPKTSYGYIRRGKPIGSDEVYAVEAFVEKPDPETAARYVAEGYLWNSGNFLFRADVLLAELARFEPAMVTAVEAAVAGASNDLGFVRLEPDAFASAPQKSIDYAVMEKTDRAAVVAGNFRWSDIGSWDAIFDIAERDKSGNAIHGTVVTSDARNCVIHSVDRLTAVRRRRRSRGGVDARCGAGDAARRAPRRCASSSPSSRARKRPEATDHRRGHRPWGYYDSIDAGRALPGQAHRGPAGRHAVAAEAPPSRRALGGGARHRRGHDRIGRQSRARERVRSTSRSAPCTASPTRARSRSS